MTRQEAIETIRMALAEVEWEYPMDYTVAFRMAIEALEKLDNLEERHKALVDACDDLLAELKERS